MTAEAIPDDDIQTLFEAYGSLSQKVDILAKTLADYRDENEALLVKLLQRVDTLVDSHNEIKGHTAQIMEQVEPMIDAVSTSVIGKMLNIKKKDGNDE